MKSFARPLFRFPVVWIILACAAALGSWIVTQPLLPVHMPHLPISAVIQHNPLPRIAEDRAIAAALNDFDISPNEITLQHPRHQASFSDQGVTFTPQGGGPEWGWQLSQVRQGAEGLEGVVLAEVLPTNDADGVVRFDRGVLIEQYLAQANSLEQQFVLPDKLPLDGKDLIIVGEVTSVGSFVATETGWRWSDANGEVHLGDVYVFDATGAAIPATMRVTATQTEIRIGDTYLSQAEYPVTIDPEIGANDFRLSDMGGDILYDAFDPAVAYNPALDEYLVVWSGDDHTSPLVDDEYEIFGQRVAGATGAKIGVALRLSDMGPEGDPDYGAFNPAVAYNGIQDEYLVVWSGDMTTPSHDDNEFEIYGQLVEADTGSVIGGPVSLSQMGPSGNADYDAANPAVAYNPTQDEYLVVWAGDDNTSPLVEGENEIFGQRVVGATGARIGSDLRLSDMGPNGDPAYDAFRPAVVYNPTQEEYFVLWRGDDNTGALVDNEFEIFGQRVAGATGAELGGDLQLSDMGPASDPAYDADFPDVAYNPTQDEYLVIWGSDDNTGSLVDDEFEIYGQRVAGATGAVIGGHVRLSDMGPDGDPDYDASRPAVAYNPTQEEYLVVWRGDDNSGDLVDEAREVFGQRVAGVTGAEIGGDLRLSEMGPEGDPAFDALSPAVVYNPTKEEYLVAWDGDDNTSPLMDEEFEIFGQRVAGATGAEIGGDLRLSEMGPIEDTRYSALYPAVAYNPTQDEYLVVWAGDDNTGTLVDQEFEIFGQRVSGATGEEIGGDLRLSNMGPDGDWDYFAFEPALAYNATQDEYLVVWHGSDVVGGLSNPKYEIYGQRVAGASGAKIGSDFRLSDMGPEGDPDYDAINPAVAYNQTQNEYLVVWQGEDNTGPLVANEEEIFGQRVAGATGSIIGGDLRLSDMGPDGDPLYDASAPAVAYNPTQDEYLVVWSGDDNSGSLVLFENEIFGQRLVGASGAEIGGDFRLSDMGPDGITSYSASSPAVAYNPTQDEYLVVWRGDDNTGPLVDDENEVFGQRVAGATGAEIGGDLRLSAMGPDGDTNYGASSPSVVYNSIQGEYLVVWAGDDNTGFLMDEEYEIYGQRVAGATGTQIGGHLRLSDMGPDGDLAYLAGRPAVAYNITQNEYLAVWEGDDNNGALVDNEFEIFGQRYAPGFDLYLPLIQR